MKFERPLEVEQICQQLKQADYPRGQDRSMIDRLANGAPPYSPEEVEENHIYINVNDLSLMRLSQNARMQFAQNFLQPGRYFTLRTDYGKAHNRIKYGITVTREINKVLKQSLDFYECFRSKFALNILHGIGPAAWPDDQTWCPEPLAIADLLIPDGVHLSFKDLPFFAIQRSYSGPELMRIVNSRKRDPAWNTRMMKKVLKWMADESRSLAGTYYSEIWKPEKVQENLKSNGGLLGWGRAPTLDVFDFYYWSDDGGVEGWRRRIIPDRWSADGTTQALTIGKDQWLYDAGDRIFARKREEIFSCQFADLSAVAPFRYHSVRSLGFLMYSVCHLQNRLRCKFNESVFEALTIYFRANNEDDFQRALRVNLVHRGIIDKSLDFIPASDRFQVPHNLVQLGLATNQKLMEDNVMAYRANPDYASDQIEKTARQVMAELHASTQMVSAGIQQAQHYQSFEYMEILRRFCLRGSRDPDVLKFQARCLKQGVPEKLLHNAEAWDLEPERVLGGGNKALSLAIAQQLMQMRHAYDPEAQRTILRITTQELTDDASLSESLVPDAPAISDSVLAGQLAFGTLMAGAPVAMKDGINLQEYVQALIVSIAAVVQRIEATGSMATLSEVYGLQNASQHAAQNLQVMSQDPEQAQLVRQFEGQLSQINNMLRAYAQRLQEQQGQEGNGDPTIAKTQAQIQAELMKAQAKADNTRDAHAQRTAQRQIAFEMEQERKEQEHGLELQRRERESALESRIKAMEQMLKAQMDQKIIRR